MADLSASHLAGLDWFRTHSGQTVRWPDPLPDGTFLVNKAKGIHKPAGWRHALSVRQVLAGPYEDRAPEMLPGGGWRYRYFQEGDDPNQRDAYFTNRGLIACRDDGVPVGVLIQKTPKPKVTYDVLGLAWVRAWEDGYFILESVGSPASESSKDAPHVPPFDPSSIEEGRRRIAASIVARQGQGRFRREVLEAYHRRCAITNCDVEQALEAAHIVPYRGEQTNSVQNGILLRADLHTLFDLKLIAIDESSMRLLLHSQLVGTSYATLSGSLVRVPQDDRLKPSRDAILMHRREAGL